MNGGTEEVCIAWYVDKLSPELILVNKYEQWKVTHSLQFSLGIQHT